MNRFLNEPRGSQVAFLDGGATERLCGPLKEHIEAHGGRVEVGQGLRKIHVGADGRISGVELKGGEILTADEYVLAVPVDVLKLILPPELKKDAFFAQLSELRGIPVINIQLWFDRKLKQSENHLVFSRSPLLSVYADMSQCCREYRNPDRSMLELVFAPCDETGGSSVNWLKRSDEEVVNATMKELESLFPDEIAADGSKARLLKSSVVRTARSVYAATPGRGKFKPSQATPISNLTLAGCYTSQKYLGSMEGAVLSGKLAAEVIVDRFGGRDVSIRPSGYKDHQILEEAVDDDSFESALDLNGREFQSRSAAQK